MQKIGKPEDLPIKNIKKVGAKLKYPWQSLQPGEWFAFAEGVRPLSAKQMASINARVWGYKFKVFRGDKNIMYCQRVDGLKVREDDLLRQNTKELPQAQIMRGKMPKPLFEDEVLITDNNVYSEPWKPTP